MREIGGYIELDTYRDQMLHEDGILLNSGRGCLWYLLKARKDRFAFVLLRLRAGSVCESRDRGPLFLCG